MKITDALLILSHEWVNKLLIRSVDSAFNWTLVCKLLP